MYCRSSNEIVWNTCKDLLSRDLYRWDLCVILNITRYFIPRRVQQNPQGLMHVTVWGQSGVDVGNYSDRSGVW
jgi:hypothetical protein